MTTHNENMPPLPVVAYRSLQPSGGYTYCNTPQFFDNAEPLCKVSDAQAYAAQCTAEIEAKLAAAEKRIAELEFMVFKMGHRAQYTPSTHTSSVLHIFSNKVIWTGHDTGTELSLKLAFEATAKEHQ